MRQVAVSTDRFLAFARRTSGKIGEDPNDVLATSDAEMEAAQRELEKFRKQLFERTTAFTTGAARGCLRHAGPLPQSTSVAG